MLRIINREIIPTIWLAFKNLRMSFMQYLMLVVIYPLTYLIISIVSSGGNSNIGIYLSGMFISVVISLFINMQAALIVSANNINIIEMYTVYKLKPLNVFIGNSIFHFIMELPLMVIIIIIAMVNRYEINMFYIVLWMIISFVFLAFLSIYMGGLIRNPNLANPIINTLYMIIVMFTPLYNDIANVSKTVKIFYLINPMTHIVSLFRKGMGMPEMCKPFISIIILSVLTILLIRKCYIRWKDAKAIEKLNLY